MAVFVLQMMKIPAQKGD